MLIRAPLLLFLSSFLLLLLFTSSSRAQEVLLGQECLDRFKPGKEDFVLDVDESVKDGATFLSSPPLLRYRDCVSACCRTPGCNVALMENGPEPGSVQSCYLFDCVYRQKWACKFVRKKGFSSAILDTVVPHLDQDQDQNPEADRPPVANGGPDRVVQPQDRLTLNGILSKDDHGIDNYQWNMITEYPYAVIEKTNFDDQIQVSNLTSGSYKFQLTVIDTIGQSDSTQITVLVLTPEQSEHHCMAPVKIGPCRGSFPRWHYNAASERCEGFLFGGCKENRNNYLSKDECSNACSGSEKSEKSGRGLPLPTDQVEQCGAPCSAEQFSCANGCCLDRALECDSVPQCSDGSDEEKCEDLTDKFRILQQIPVDEQKVRCTEQPCTGSCRETLTRWYYNPVQRTCQRFNYGGCGGNDNRFHDEESCMKVCKGVTEKDVFERREEFERRESESQMGIIAIAAVLGVAILVLLVVLIFCLTRGKKQTQHQRVPVYNAAADGDHLVYNTTTKPI